MNQETMFEDTLQDVPRGRKYVWPAWITKLLAGENKCWYSAVKLDRPGRPGKLTALQSSALAALQGVLLRYRVDKAGLLGAATGDYIPWSTPMRKNKSEVHRHVASELLRLFEETR